MNSRILPIFALLLAAMLFFAYVSPTWNGAIADTQAAIESNDAALVSAQEYNKKKEVLAQQYNEMDATSLKRLNALLPDSVDNVSLILSLNALAAGSGLVLSNVDVSAGTNADATGSLATNTSPVNSIDLSLAATGSYASFQKFLDGVERSQRLLDVRNLNVTGSNTNQYTYQMTIRLYWLR